MVSLDYTPLAGEKQKCGLPFGLTSRKMKSISAQM
jgi:hypothetical protein